MIQRMGKTCTFRADPDLAAVLRDEARAQRVSVSRFVRDACRARLNLDSVDVDRRQFNRFAARSPEGAGARTEEGVSANG